MACSNVARLNKMIPIRLKPTLELLETAIKQVHSETLQPSQGMAMASLASAVVKVLESGIMEERLSRLEEAIKDTL